MRQANDLKMWNGCTVEFTIFIDQVLEGLIHSQFEAISGSLFDMQFTQAKLHLCSPPTQGLDMLQKDLSPRST